MRKEISKKSRLTLTLLSFFLGGFGLDRLYLEQYGLALLKFLTLGGFGFWALFDFILAVSGEMKDKEGKKVQKW